MSSAGGEERQSYAAAAKKPAKFEDSDSLASDIAKRKTGDPGAYERVSSTKGPSYESSLPEDKEPAAKEPPSADKLKKPLIITGVVLALVGAFIALVVKSSKDETSSSTNSDTSRVD
ncbi:hypothetical protein SELMODRAFT_443274 [Selaginella moellendorffii]|uniref:Uncharacterized protein n=1 Tax=Selaginella moellendorffii TaxID=88036 RepID=D8S020_SELML|nr:uncharacterized protein LOC9649196 [Selaginella moellendorffii]EFJ22395.1 hypothetical protein SELMODRAFT_443274 [Selaginella moellendorffii]|eukprot:XP_002976726.1 uncharacterized protein LOC9649196 [Selaginella moellendorffii]